MARLSSHQSATSTKCLLIGDSGSGKTAAMASLVKAGYSLRILDYDNGLDFLTNLLRQECPDKLDSVYFRTLTDKMGVVGNKPMPKGIPQAFQKGLDLLTKWKEEDGEELGGVDKWDNNAVLVIDSFTFFCKAALRQVLAINGRLGQKPYQSDWGDAQAMVEEVLSLLYSDSVQCNVLVLTHIDYIEGEGTAIIKGLPMSIGKKLSPRIPRYFNSVLLVDRGKEGRFIRTSPKGLIEAKAASPKVPATLPIETGLADYFNLVRGSSPNASKETK